MKYKIGDYILHPDYGIAKIINYHENDNDFIYSHSSFKYGRREMSPMLELEFFNEKSLFERSLQFACQEAINLYENKVNSCCYICLKNLYRNKIIFHKGKIYRGIVTRFSDIEGHRIGVRMYSGEDNIICTFDEDGWFQWFVNKDLVNSEDLIKFLNNTI